VKNDTVLTVVKRNDPLKIKKTDVLNIGITSLSLQEDAIFSSQPGSKSSGNESSVSGGYVVDSDGNIHLHKIGKIKAEGLTRADLKSVLERELLPFLKDPVVSVSFANHFVTVLGEVGKPQLLNVPAEDIPILDVMAQSGNVTINAQLNKIMIIRDKGENTKEIKRINLEDPSIFNSAWYYIQPNDIVVVNPDEKRVVADLKRTRYQQTSTMILQALTTVIIVYQTFFRK